MLHTLFKRQKRSQRHLELNSSQLGVGVSSPPPWNNKILFSVKQHNC